MLKADTEEKIQQSKESKHPGLVILSADEMRTRIIELTKGRGRYAQRLIKNSGSDFAKANTKVSTTQQHSQEFLGLSSDNVTKLIIPREQVKPDQPMARETSRGDSTGSW